ncbi:MAG: GNAT family N-acetyltransferase [Candidatus Uhrbacteria bacterium]
MSKNAQPVSHYSVTNVCQLHHVLVAVDDSLGEPGKIVGMATLVVIEQFVGVRGRIEDVVVDQDYRKQGIGRELVLRLHEAAKERRVKMITLSSQQYRTEANRLYVSIGYKPVDTNVYVFELPKD